MKPPVKDGPHVKFCSREKEPKCGHDVVFKFLSLGRQTYQLHLQATDLRKKGLSLLNSENLALI